MGRTFVMCKLPQPASKAALLTDSNWRQSRLSCIAAALHVSSVAASGGYRRADKNLTLFRSCTRRNRRCSRPRRFGTWRPRRRAPAPTHCCCGCPARRKPGACWRMRTRWPASRTLATRVPLILPAATRLLTDWHRTHAASADPLCRLQLRTSSARPTQVTCLCFCCCSAIKAGDHAAAVRHYTAALGLPRPPLPGGAAVLHANRGAAHQGAGALAEGIADCGRARALDPSYAKVVCFLCPVCRFAH